MRKIDPASTEDARAYCFLLLKFRQRSRKELEQRLKNKKFNPGIINKTLAFLQEKGFINDEAFTAAWVNSRLKVPLGLNRIKQELNLKGVAPDIIAAALAEAKKDYSEGETLRRVIKQRRDRLKGLGPKKIRQRLYGYLLRRGFSADIIIEAIQKEIASSPSLRSGSSQ